MTERCKFAQQLLFSGRPGRLFCGNPNCTAVFEIKEEGLRLIEGDCRCDFVLEKIKDIRLILERLDGLSALKREDLSLRLRDLENEVGDFDLGAYRA